MTRVYYRISENGQEYYAALLEDYNSIHTGVQLILSRSNEENEK
jgi:DNA-binding PadR family transcriptional regulator